MPLEATPALLWRSLSIYLIDYEYNLYAEAFSLFVHKLGIKLVAASGNVRVEAQGDNVEIVAKKVLELMSTSDWINLTAKQGIRLNGGGTELEISPKGILGFTDGQFLVHADDHATDAPQSRCRC
ncbi:DUF2345 domain-containing protein [Burkholderia sp. RF4-BP95]|uniref:DUF2345 domain-containing protein n=1 Tax=Burkholderia sp. RF4-BP95 TaxID=1637845 RepID=UPI000AB0F9D4|nr:DUF2345 domain-containing protein [Burkholderia sp. RF4-BP95]